MKTTIEEIQQYFKNKIIKGEYTIHDAKTPNLVRFKIDNLYSFSFFYFEFEFQQFSSDLNFMIIPVFSSNEIKSLKKIFNLKIKEVKQKQKEETIKELENQIETLKQQ